MNQNTFCKNCHRIPSQCCCIPVKTLTDEDKMKAFPLSKEKNYGQDGMDLRDYFAAKAMQGMLSDPDHQLGAWDNYVDWHKNLTSQAYQIADAMMKAREVK